MKKQTTLNICIINFLLAVSSTIGMTVIPLIVIDSLGLSLLVLGLIEGVSEFLSSTIRFYSGFFFDRKENKLELLLYPIYLALISKLVLLHPNSIMVVATKFIERLSNGAFGPIRDALVLKLSTKEGKDLSLLNISKSAGCLFGPLIVTIAISYKFKIDGLIILCVILCTVAIVIAYLLKKTPLSLNNLEAENITLRLSDIKKLKIIYPIILLSFIFFLSRFSDGLIIIFLREIDAPQWVYLSTIGIFNGFMLFISPIIGTNLDSGKFKWCLVFTFISMILFNLTCLQITEANLLLIFIALFFWGSQRVSSQMTFLYAIKQNIKQEYLGRAVGAYSLLTGISILLASFICGYLAKITFTYIFVYSLITSLIGLILTVILLINKRL